MKSSFAWSSGFLLFSPLLTGALTRWVRNPFRTNSACVFRHEVTDSKLSASPSIIDSSSSGITKFTFPTWGLQLGELKAISCKSHFYQRGSNMHSYVVIAFGDFNAWEMTQWYKAALDYGAVRWDCFLTKIVIEFRQQCLKCSNKRRCIFFHVSSLVFTQQPLL